jgi:hypothetical protein
METTARASKQDRTTLILLVIAAMVAVGGIGFALGHVTAPSGTSGGAANPSGRGGFGRNLPSLAPGQTFNPGDFGGGNGQLRVNGLGGGLSGTVQSITGTTMTILMSDGQSVTVDLTGRTTYHGETSASASQVAVGTTVTVQLDTAALASASPNPGASGGLGGRTLTAKDVLITIP